MSKTSTTPRGRKITSKLSQRLRSMKKGSKIVVTDRTRPVLGSILWSTQNATGFGFESTSKDVKAPKGQSVKKGCQPVQVTRVA